MRKIWLAAGALGLGYLVWSTASKADAPKTFEGTWEVEDPESYSLFSSDPTDDIQPDDFVYFFLRKVDHDQISDVVMEARAVATKQGVVEVKNAKVVRQIRGTRTPPEGLYRVAVDQTIDPENVNDIHTAQPK
jgi:hypothetical protein